MNPERLAWRVGAFVLVGLVLLAGLMIRFSKGIAFGEPTYEVRLQTANVGGIKRGAVVLLAGVPVGSVAAIELAEDGRAVRLHLRIFARYPIWNDARFVIEEAGFLGDQYVAIVPTRNAGERLKAGDLVSGEAPFNLQEAARAATGFLRRADDAIREINAVVGRLDRILLTEGNLSNVSLTLGNFRELSERVNSTAARLDGLVNSNAPGITASVSNLVDFSGELDRVALDLSRTLATNRGQWTAAISNLEAASQTAHRVLSDLEAGHGLAGSLLKDARLQQDWRQTVSNLSVLSSNLNRFGLLYKPKHAKGPEPTSPPALPAARPF
jgi:phospholipid/cholesterol/gamma-HCH transport system substrate-binding protein